MRYQLVNQTRALLIVPLRSGVSLHIAPGKKSTPVEELDLANNQKIAKLKNLGMLSVVPATH
jgi:hypothetical protein